MFWSAFLLSRMWMSKRHKYGRIKIGKLYTFVFMIEKERKTGNARDE